jgi:5-methylcytosine-specific restriction endonuclease McrA
VIKLNKWGIPNWLEEKVKKRDKFCVYCHVKLKEYPRTKGTPGDKATWEHIDNNGPNSEFNVVRCCSSCNASKGTKKLSDWLESSYCKKKKISKETIANVVRKSYP